MKVCIWWQTIDAPWGGGNAFFRALSKELVDRGVQVVQKPSPDCDAVFINAWNLGPGRYNSSKRTREVRSWGRSTVLGRLFPERLWKQIHLSNVPLIHRVDGVAQLGRGAQSEADPVQFSINSLCDLTVFQSEYSRQAFAQFDVVPENWCIVHNGVDGSVFYPAESRSGSDDTFRIAASSWSPNRNKGFEQLSQLSLIPGVELHFFGQWNPTIDQLSIVDHGPQKPSELAVMLREMDAFVHAGLNEACSNSILEALATCLPVMYVDSGANKELVGEHGVVLTDNLAGSVEKLIEGHSKARELLLGERDRFLIAHAADRYLQALESAVEIRKALCNRSER